jgi:hypothetical protein
VTFTNTAGAFLALYVVYDLFYTLFHRFLHHRSVYWLVHKHHHRQHAPTRCVASKPNVPPEGGWLTWKSRRLSDDELNVYGSLHTHTHTHTHTQRHTQHVRALC